MKPDARHLKRTAIHEAGHAVMHYLERVPFESVTIVPDPVTGSDGAVHPRLGPLSLWDRQRPKTLRILMAGKVAEEYHAGKAARGCGHAQMFFHLWCVRGWATKPRDTRLAGGTSGGTLASKDEEIRAKMRNS